MNRRADLTIRELADMLEPASRDTVKYLERGFRDLVERRHLVCSDERMAEDFGDGLVNARSA